MIVLDADSLMSGRAMLRLAHAMESHPKVGLIQTVPVVAGCSTLFGRWQQFAARLYGPVATRSEEHTSELQSLMRISYAVFCLKKKKKRTTKAQQRNNRKR